MTGGPVRVLVVVASRHGSTAEIGAALARALGECAAGRSTGIVAVPVHVDQRPDPAPFDAVVLGSAVYAGGWLAPAREYAATHAALLRTRPTWLFSSGPLGKPPFPPDEPHDVGPIAQLLGARGHVVLPGRLDPARLSLGERAMVTAMRTPVGDFRDWPAVRAWGGRLAHEIGAARGTAPVGT